MDEDEPGNDRSNENRGRAFARPDSSFAHLLISHHTADYAHHCHRVRLGGKEVFVCARCAGLYPALVAAMVFAFVWPVADQKAYGFMAVFSLPTFLDWASVRLDFRKSGNWTRTATGLTAGIGWGIALPAYFRNPSSSEFWFFFGLLVVAAIVVEVVARRTGQDDNVGE